MIQEGHGGKVVYYCQMKWRNRKNEDGTINKCCIESDDGNVMVTKSKTGNEWIYTRWEKGNWYLWDWKPVLYTKDVNEAKK